MDLFLLIVPIYRQGGKSFILSTTFPFFEVLSPAFLVMQLRKKLSMDQLSEKELDVFESIVQSLHLVDCGEETAACNEEELHMLALAVLVCCL